MTARRWLKGAAIAIASSRRGHKSFTSLYLFVSGIPARQVYSVTRLDEGMKTLRHWTATAEYGPRRPGVWGGNPVITGNPAFRPPRQTRGRKDTQSKDTQTQRQADAKTLSFPRQTQAQANPLSQTDTQTQRHADAETQRRRDAETHRRTDSQTHRRATRRRKDAQTHRHAGESLPAHVRPADRAPRTKQVTTTRCGSRGH